MIYFENGKLFIDMMIVYGVAAVFAAIALVLFFRAKAKKAPAAAAAAPAPAAKAEPVAAAASAGPAVAPGSAGKLKLYDTPPKTAAMVMAIVADQLGKPLNELRFISIKEVN